MCKDCRAVFNGEQAEINKKKHRKLVEELNLSCQHDECKLRFCTPTEYKKHMKVHHGITAKIEKKFICIDCGTGFAREHDLQEHMRNARMNNHGICEEKFCTQRLLRQHRLNYRGV